MKTGVVGFGSIGARYANWLRELGMQVGVYDADEKKSGKLGCRDLRFFPSLSSLLGWGPCKVIIATPPSDHNKVAISAIKGGADVLIEKPLALSIHEIEEIEILCHQTGKVGSGVCNMRYHPAIQAVRKVLPKIGRPLAARASFSHRLSQMRPEGVVTYATSSEEGGGVIMDCIHEIDILRWLLGPIKEIRGWPGKIGDDPMQADDIADIQIAFDSGCHGIAHLDFLSRLKRRGIEIIGTDATIIWESLGKLPEFGKVVIGDNRGFETIFFDESIDREASYKAMLRDFLSARENTQSLQEGKEALAASLLASNVEWSPLGNVERRIPK